MLSISHIDEGRYVHKESASVYIMSHESVSIWGNERPRLHVADDSGR
jgi:hypothetical protein